MKKKRKRQTHEKQRKSLSISTRRAKNAIKKYNKGIMNDIIKPRMKNLSKRELRTLGRQTARRIRKISPKINEYIDLNKTPYIESMFDNKMVSKLKKMTLSEIMRTKKETAIKMVTELTDIANKRLIFLDKSDLFFTPAITKHSDEHYNIKFFKVNTESANVLHRQLIELQDFFSDQSSNLQDALYYHMNSIYKIFMNESPLLTKPHDKHFIRAFFTAKEKLQEMPDVMAAIRSLNIDSSEKKALMRFLEDIMTTAIITKNTNVDDIVENVRHALGLSNWGLQLKRVNEIMKHTNDSPKSLLSEDIESFIAKYNDKFGYT